MKFKLSSELNGGNLVVNLEGRIGGETSLQVFQEIKTLVTRHEDKNLILDFRGVDFMDSSGLGSLVAVNSTLLRDGRELTLVSIPKNIKELLRITNLLKILKIADTAGDVLK